MPFVIAVDDEPDVLATVGRVLEREDLEYKLANSGMEALDVIEERRPDLLILDVVMPQMDGISVCERLRQKPEYITLPILFLTARGTTDDIVRGFEVGGDDYVTKPFELVELRARIRALLRRGTYSDGADSTGITEVSDLKLDSNSYQVRYKDKETQLTATEHRLLRHLMEHPDEVLTLSDLLVQVWDYPPDTGDPDLVRAHIRNLRSKIEKNPDHKYIRTVHGVGYMFVTDSKS